MSDFFEALTYNKYHILTFSSVMFFLLFTVFFFFYTLAFNKVSIRNSLLLLFSFYFYYKVSGAAVLLLLFISTSDFFIGKGIFSAQKKSGKRRLLMLSLLVNLGVLIYFKYFIFLAKTWFDINNLQDPLVINIITPLGISYFIFKTLTYIFDLYNESLDAPERNYINYLLYVSFFPNILMGPISKAADLLPQIKNKLFITNEHIGKGLFLIMTGAFKKIFIADFLAGNFVVRVFEAPDYFTGFDNLMASYANAIQLYFDFSGYTDIVIGIACLMGFSIMPNFNKPFSATNVTDFWRRWHLTLSAWLRDYIFTPLALKYRNIGTFGAVLAIMITFILCGIWHDAKITFVVWGALHGLAMAWDIITNKIRAKIKNKINLSLYRFISIFITFHFICFSFIIFSAKDMQSALAFFTKIFTDLDFSLFFRWIVLYTMPFVILLLGILLHFTPFKWNTALMNIFTKLHWSLKILIVVFAFIVIYQMFSSHALPFVYLKY